VSIPRRHLSRATSLAHGAHDHFTDPGLERSAADLERVDRADVLSECQLRAGMAQIDPRQPLAVAAPPPAGGVVVADVVAQPQLGEPVPGAHQIATEILPRVDEIAHSFLRGRGHPDRVQRSDHQ
jgi:hypothetical protein